MEKLNIAEILKDCPTGMELDCALFENLEFDHIDKDNGDYAIICRVKREAGFYNTHTFTEYGCYSTEKYSKCVIFPKGKTTWEGFQRPYKDGDVLYIDCNDDEDTYAQHQYIFILKQINEGNINAYCYINGANEYKFKICWLASMTDIKDIKYGIRFATEKEKQKLFDTIEAYGYKWNAETKTLEKLIVPKFKLGDRIRHKTHIRQGNVVTEIKDTYYILDDELALPFTTQDEYELIPNKFDITTLMPFTKVLVRYDSLETWHIQFFKNYNRQYSTKYPFACICNNNYSQCIPFKNNEHLLGTTNDCDEFYKTWED